MPALPEFEKVSGENASVNVNGIDILVDGDIELTIEREVFEWKVRGVAATQHIPSKRVTISGSVSGVPTNGMNAVLRSFLGTDSIDATTDLSSISLPNVTITYDFGGDTFTLGDVKLKSVKPSAKDGDVIRVDIDFVANRISLG